MRLAGTIQNLDDAKRFQTFLTNSGIESRLELSTDTNWGSHTYGDREAKLWILDEDQFLEAKELLLRFLNNPKDSFFQSKKTIEIKPTVLSQNQEPLQPSFKFTAATPHLLTLYFLITCILIFAIDLATTPSIQQVPLPYPATPIYSSEVVQGFLYDFPKAFEILGELVSTYGVKDLQDPALLPEPGKALLEQYRATPYWKGFYLEWLLKLKGDPKAIWEESAPLFEKIREGQIWRLFTPCLLHGSFIHILFNMIWLWILGAQIEERIKSVRYLLLILAAGIIPNTAQYLMGGPEFLGFSGIIVAFFTFIWTRQRRAGWEGYKMDKPTIVMLSVFILGLFTLQVASFFLEVYAGSSFSPGIANTAHLAGGVVGYLFGRTKTFQWQK